MKFFYETATGRLISIGDDDPLLPNGVNVVDVPNYDVNVHMWDQATRSVISRPPKVLRDRLVDILTDPRFTDDFITMWNALNATRRTQLRNGLIRLLGSQRWRTGGEDLLLS